MFSFEPKKGVSYRYDYAKICDDLNRLEAEGTVMAQREAAAILRDCGSNDLFFLLVFFLRLDFLNNDFHVPLIYEVQDNHNDTLDLWPREYGKSTIITKGCTIFDIIRDKERTHCIFSFNRAIAKGFLRDIKTELETNELLKKVFPAAEGNEWWNIFYDKPDRQSVKWSEDEGIVVKRNTIRREATLEAWGLTDGARIPDEPEPRTPRRVEANDRDYLSLRGSVLEAEEGGAFVCPRAPGRRRVRESGLPDARGTGQEAPGNGAVRLLVSDVAAPGSRREQEIQARMAVVFRKARRKSARTIRFSGFSA